MTLGTGVSSSAVDLHPDAVVLVGAEQMIDDVEALLALGIIGAANVDEADEAAFRIVAQEAQGPSTICAGSAAMVSSP